MKALVISGGGSKGAFAGGVAEYLINEQKQEYDMFVGSSTGSLLIPHLSIGKIDKIKEAYTSVVQNDVFNICPFIIKKDRDGNLKSKINHFNVIKMFLKRKKTFGETKNLRKTIANLLSPEDYNEIKSLGKKVIVTASNLTRNVTEYKYLEDHSYEDFCDWMWISACFVPFMSLVEKNGCEYADGGFGNYIPIEEAIANGAKHIDVIVLRPRHRVVEQNKSRNAFDILLQSMGFMLNQIVYDDIRIGHLESIYNDDIHVRFFFTPRVLTEYSFHFEPSQMREWWKEGFDYAKERVRF
ncbi:MAG: patatin-like phospholipase family protein [Saprospiraceae bacterium]|nr:patatin-like phospholipase family protein [Saprospiraceae bacterium]